MAFVESAALAAGLCVGRFTSPHLTHYNERIVINREPIQDETFAALVETIIPVLEEAEKRPEFGAPTEFEVGTILAFLYFAQAKVDLAIIEVGMGGRLDSTNVIRPLVVGLTHIDLDHQEILGPDLMSIAREKAGIIKKRTPVVLAPEYPEVDQVISVRANACNAPLYRVGHDVSYQLLDWGDFGADIKLGWGKETQESYRINLLGAHQVHNAAVAFGLLKTLGENGFSMLTNETIRCGLATAVWPGRLERFPGEPEIVLDGGHNPDGFRAMATAIDQIFPKRSVVGLIGILNNRPVEEMANIIASKLTFVITTDVPGDKAPSSERAFNAFAAAGLDAQSYPNPVLALEKAIALAKNTHSLLLIAGSLYLIGHLRPRVIERG